MRKFYLVIGLFVLLSSLLAACQPVAQVESEPSVNPPASNDNDQGQDLVNIEWQWSELDENQPSDQPIVPNEGAYSITFLPDGTVSIKADCNMVGGTYALDGDRMSITLGFSTLAFCREESLDQQFQKLLAEVESFNIEGDLLSLGLKEDAGALGFTNGGLNATLLLGGWNWVSFTDPLQSFDVENPEQYKLEFFNDGQLAIQADCNNATGTYAVDGQSITLEVGAMTRAMCPEDSRSNDFIEYLGNVRIYFFDGSDLMFDLFADGGTMRFSR